MALEHPCSQHSDFPKYFNTNCSMEDPSQSWDIFSDCGSGKGCSFRKGREHVSVIYPSGTSHADAGLSTEPKYIQITIKFKGLKYI